MVSYIHMISQLHNFLLFWVVFSFWRFCSNKPPWRFVWSSAQIKKNNKPPWITALSAQILNQSTRGRIQSKKMQRMRKRKNVWLWRSLFFGILCFFFFAERALFSCIFSSISPLFSPSRLLGWEVTILATEVGPQGVLFFRFYLGGVAIFIKRIPTFLNSNDSNL